MSIRVVKVEKLIPHVPLLQVSLPQIFVQTLLGIGVVIMVITVRKFVLAEEIHNIRLQERRRKH